jgi:hypothetical protein
MTSTLMELAAASLTQPAPPEKSCCFGSYFFRNRIADQVLSTMT